MRQPPDLNPESTEHRNNSDYHTPHSQPGQDEDHLLSLERHDADLERWRAEYSEILAVELESITDALLFELLMARDSQHVKQIWDRLSGGQSADSSNTPLATE
ncbi:hypothetical protein GR140_32140 (plasmid) [Pseudomonas putida]|uniref:hypothetical protein n=1 Tax=Pseudomonas putida TaxID=303 RepID=UPI001BAF0100|nr:hypothetical protein [Pseudomonas putida]QUG93390.1 hypothetical protein GR140_32140 [Pseudomonas putida]